MVAVTQGRLGNRTGYTFRWQGDQTRRKVAEAVLSDMESVAALIEGYLRSTLHRITGDMADKSYAEVDQQGNRIILRFGSDSDHAFWHEVRWHPQIRQTADVWIPKLIAQIRAAMARAA